ncbi:hypothetical protein [Haladaptatus halobius]|uniref:hypothetical protein n=1 Tax=Haladaptatus halobius TaxID=2884875 RepID=UPI001D0A4EF2|nr:hypothetical protein [Haladaptatus halobius]
MTYNKTNPVESTYIESAIEQFEELEPQDPITVEEVKNFISCIQDENQKHLIGMLDTAYSIDGHLKIIKETETEYYFHDEDGSELDDMISFIDRSGTDVENIIKQSFNEKVEANTDSEISGDGFVVEKPPRWGDAEWVNRRELKYLLENGLSPAEVLDYWFIVQQGYSETDWVEYRGTSQQTISNNIYKAKRKLSERSMLRLFIS